MVTRQIFASCGAIVVAAGAALATTSASADITLGRGTTTIQRPLILPDGATLSGLGVGQTVLKAAPGFAGPLIVDSDGETLSLTGSSPGITIRGITLDGSGTAAVGVKLANADGLTLEDVEVTGTTVVGIATVGTAASQSWANVTVRDCTGWGITAQGATSASYEDIKVHNCGQGAWLAHDGADIVGFQTINNFSGNGLVLTGKQAAVEAVRSAGNAGTGILVTGADGSGSGWLSQNNGTADASFAATATGWSVVGMVLGHNPCYLGKFDKAPQKPIIQGTPVDFSGVKVVPQNSG